MVQIPSRVGQPDNDNKEEPISYGQYTIDPEAAAASHRSLPLLIASRRCYMDHQADDVVGAGDEDLDIYIQRIADHCSQEQDYLLPNTPLKEAIFRVMLSESNRAMNAVEISGVLTTAWAMTPFPRNTTPAVIQRLLDNCKHYCITRVPEPEPAAESPEPVAEITEAEAPTESVPAPESDET